MKTYLLTLTALLSVGLVAPSHAQGTASIGFVSDYYYRGVNLGDGGVYAGADYNRDGFSVGVWAIDDGSAGNDGFEYDVFASYGFSVNDIDVSLGLTVFRYTYTSDDEAEINVGASYRGVSLDYANGADNQAAGDFDYDVVSLSWAGERFGAVLGRYDNEDPAGNNQYDYFELSVSGQINGFSASASVGTKFDEVVGATAVTNNDGYMVLDISKAFEL